MAVSFKIGCLCLQKSGIAEVGNSSVSTLMWRATGPVATPWRIAQDVAGCCRMLQVAHMCESSMCSKSLKNMSNSRDDHQDSKLKDFPLLLVQLVPSSGDEFQWSVTFQSRAAHGDWCMKWEWSPPRIFHGTMFRITNCLVAKNPWFPIDFPSNHSIEYTVDEYIYDIYI